MSNRNEIVTTIKRRAKISKERQKLRDEAWELRRTQAAVNREFIRGAMNEFIKTMKNSDWQQTQYINGAFTDEFTKHVNRSNMGYTRVTKEHANAVFAYNAALEALNRVFIEAILNDTEGCRERIIDNAGIKNIAKL